MLEKWLASENLLSLAKINAIHFKHVFRECLGAGNEEVLIVSDTGYPEKRIAPLMGMSYYYAAKKLGLKVNLVAQSPKLMGESASDQVINSLKELPDGSVIILSLSQRLGKLRSLGKSYRKFAQQHDHRFVSTPSLGSVGSSFFSQFVSAIDTDYSRIRETGKKLKSALDWGKEIDITTKSGTSLHLDIRGKTSIANTGEYREPGIGGNLPAGEVYIAPNKSSTEGTVVLDGTLKHRWGSCLLKQPVTLIVERGQVTDIKGGREAQFLHKSLEWANGKARFPWGIRYIGELGIGINQDANLVGSTVLDEKVYGTAHVAMGSNYWFGGDIYAIIHMDQVFKDPLVYIDGKKLVI